MTGKSIIFFLLLQAKTMSYSKLPNDTDRKETTMVVKNFKFDNVCITDIVRKIILKTIKLWLIFIYDKIEWFLPSFLNNKQTTRRMRVFIQIHGWHVLRQINSDRLLFTSDCTELFPGEDWTPVFLHGNHLNINITVADPGFNRTWSANIIFRQFFPEICMKLKNKRSKGEECPKHQPPPLTLPGSAKALFEPKDILRKTNGMFTLDVCVCVYVNVTVNVKRQEWVQTHSVCVHLHFH